MNDTTELIVLPPPDSVRKVFTTPFGLDPYLQQIRQQIDVFVPDISTKKGRDAIASFAYRVAKGKTALDDLGKGLVAEMKKEPATVDAERKRMRDQMDAWKEEVRKPLTDWEDAETARVEHHKGMIQCIKDCGLGLIGGQPQPIQILLRELEEKIVVDASWEEFEEEGRFAKATALAKLHTALEEQNKRAAEQAELAELRAKAAEREQKDRERAIAREAAEQAKREAEAKAQAEREATIKREADAKAAAERRELELKLQAERAEREKVEAQQREQQAKADADRRESEAVAAEQRRVAAVAAEEAKEAKRREADKAHKTAVNRAALDAFMKGGLSEECAKTAVTLIAKKAIPAVSITY